MRYSSWYSCNSAQPRIIPSYLVKYLQLKLLSAFHPVIVCWSGNTLSHLHRGPKEQPNTWCVSGCILPASDKLNRIFGDFDYYYTVSQCFLYSLFFSVSFFLLSLSLSWLKERLCLDCEETNEQTPLTLWVLNQWETYLALAFVIYYLL